jgi:hypothetical protein
MARGLAAFGEEEVGMKRHVVIPFVVAAAVMPLFLAQACGPDFEPDVFVRKMRPDQPKEFAAGKLRVLLPTFPRVDLTVAFRYLNGGELSASERQAYQPTYGYLDPEWQQRWNSDHKESAHDPVAAWKAARGQYDGAAPAVSADRIVQVQFPNGGTYNSEYTNCNANAFEVATLTLAARAKTWGAKSGELSEWIKGQDAVFSNCAGGKDAAMPGIIADESPALLRQDRAYQQAAAYFYAMRYAESKVAFEAIAKDSTSPWHGIAGYLAARALVRDAFNSGKPGDFGSTATFDADKMRAAQKVLEALLKEPHSGISQMAIEKELNLVRLRTEPLARLNELAVALSGLKADPNYDQDLKDLAWYLDTQLDQSGLREDSFREESQSEAERVKGFAKAWDQFEQLRASAPLVDWLITFQSPSAGARKHAIEEFEKTQQLYWLSAALAKASGSEPQTAALIKAAAEVKADSPAWEMASYHRIRLLIASGDAEEARRLLAMEMPQVQSGGGESSINLFTGLRARASSNLKEYLAYAPRKLINQTSQEGSSVDECFDVMKDPKRKYDCVKNIGPMQFSVDAADFFNNDAPMAVLIEAARSDELPVPLRGSVAMMAWTRAVLMKDEAAAAKLFPLLPAKLQQQAGSGTGFRALVAIARNPGLRPFLDPGVQRSYSWDFVESYGDNWWCQNWEGSGYGQAGISVSALRPAFLSQAQSVEASNELSLLHNDQSAAAWIGGEIVEYARANANDPDVPEALYLVLRMIRYGCDRVDGYTRDDSKQSGGIKGVRDEAARLLRQRYASNPWTRKAGPIAG